MKKTLWSHDFTIITLGTIISAIGGTAMTFAFSLVVFDQTNSTLATGLFSALSILPAIIVPIIASPYIDSFERKKFIYGIDAFNAILYFLFTLYLFIYDFNLIIYLFFSLIVVSTNSIYQLAYTSLYPDLIPEGFAQKGYSISSLIYPSVTAIITPIASVVYESFGIEYITLSQAILLTIASLSETRIAYQEVKRAKLKPNIKSYLIELKEGMTYLWQEKGLLNVFTYMSISNSTWEGVNLMGMAFFQSSPILTTTMWAFLTSAETFGRMLGSIFSYLVRIPERIKFKISTFVYFTYSTIDGVIYFLAYPIMVILRFITGLLGVTSYTIRESSTQNYIPSIMRGRVNAFFQVFTSCFTLIARLLAGILGEYFPYQYVALGFALFAIISVYVFIVRNRKLIAPIYNRTL